MFYCIYMDVIFPTKVFQDVFTVFSTVYESNSSLCYAS